MSSIEKAPEDSPVVAYRYRAALKTPEHAAPTAMSAPSAITSNGIPMDGTAIVIPHADQHHGDRDEEDRQPDRGVPDELLPPALTEDRCRALDRARNADAARRAGPGRRRT